MEVSLLISKERLLIPLVVFLATHFICASGKKESWFAGQGVTPRLSLISPHMLWLL
jgi:hypothetical protein